MAEQTAAAFFIWDTKDGQVAVETVRPEGGSVRWPLQVLRATGPREIPPPRTPMSAQEFTAWRVSLEDAGYDIDIRFK